MRVAIIEDELICSKQLQEYLEDFNKEINDEIICGVFDRGTEFLNSFHNDWDLILLDIEMPGMDGMTVAREIRKKDGNVLIIFVTQMAQYAIAGYEVEALDYVLKPVNYHIFSLKMKRVMKILESRQDDYLLLQKGTVGNKVPLNDILYIEVFNHTLHYHTVNEVITVTGSRTISQMEEELKNKGFCRCHQCYLVNLHKVIRYDSEQVYLDKDALPISRKRRKGFLQALLMQWGG